MFNQYRNVVHVMSYIMKNKTQQHDYCKKHTFTTTNPNHISWIDKCIVQFWHTKGNNI